MNTAEKSAKKHQDYRKTWRSTLKTVDRKAVKPHAEAAIEECRRLLREVGEP